MLLCELVRCFKPWSEPGVAWAPQEDWYLHGYRLWTCEPTWMDALTKLMRRFGWLFGPVIVDDGFIQDAHHRIVVALVLGWYRRDIPIERVFVTNVTPPGTCAGRTSMV